MTVPWWRSGFERDLHATGCASRSGERRQYWRLNALNYKQMASRIQPQWEAVSVDPIVFDAVRFLVNQARLKGIGNLAALRTDAIAAGFAPDDVDSAITV